MEEGKKRGRIDRKSSIETEPRTLNLDQIQVAREEALYVMKTRSIEEALRIFTEVQEPMVAASAEDGEDYVEWLEEELELMRGGDDLHVAALRYVVSAPF